MADEIDKARAEQICNGLSKYYKSQQCEYNGLFMTYIDQLIEDDFDDELITAIIDELYEINAVQTQLIEFIEWNETNNHYDFPFSISIQGISKQEQAEFIVEILKRCDKEKDPKFDSIIPECMYFTLEKTIDFMDYIYT